MTVTLTLRSGDVVEKISPESITDAVASLFSKEPEGESAEAAGEEPNIWLSYGQDMGKNWEEHSLGFYRDGRLIYTIYEKEDDLDPSFEVQKFLERDEAQRLLLLLAEGKLGDVKGYTWDS